MTNLHMPALSPNMEYGTLKHWRRNVGDRVAPGMVICEVETDKATMEVEAIEEGVITEILVPSNTADVKVGDVIAVLRVDIDETNSIATPRVPHKMRPVDGTSTDLKKARTNLLQDIEATVSEMKLDMLAHLFIQRLNSATKRDFTGKAKNNLIDLHNLLKDQFEAHQFGDLDRLAQTSAKIQRINEYETVMDAYERKIKVVRNDPDLDEEDREEKLEYWKRLRDRDVSAFESGGS